MTGSQKLLKTMGFVVLALALVLLVVGIVVTVGNVPPAQGTGVLMVIGAVAAGLVGFEGIRAGKDSAQLNFFIGLCIIVAIYQFFGTFIGVTASLTNMETTKGLWSTLVWGPWNSLDWSETIGLIITGVMMFFGIKAKKELQ